MVNNKLLQYWIRAETTTTTATTASSDWESSVLLQSVGSTCSLHCADSLEKKKIGHEIQCAICLTLITYTLYMYCQSPYSHITYCVCTCTWWCWICYTRVLIDTYDRLSINSTNSILSKQREGASLTVTAVHSLRDREGGGVVILHHRQRSLIILAIDEDTRGLWIVICKDTSDCHFCSILWQLRLLQEPWGRYIIALSYNRKKIVRILIVGVLKS